MVVTAAIAVLIVNFDYLGAIAGTIITISAIAGGEIYLRSKNEFRIIKILTTTINKLKQK
jgi:hypothetical protein